MSSAQITFDRRALLREVTEQMRKAAQTNGLKANTDAMAVMVTPEAVGVNIPNADLANLDVASLLAGQPVLDGMPLMYWFVSPSDGAAESVIPTEFLTVVADQNDGTVSLRRLDGEILAQGDLGIDVRPSGAPTPGIEPRLLGVSVSGNIDKLKFGKNRFELCGSLTISAGPFDVNINGCIVVTK